MKSMSKRFGRNQKRKMKAEIAFLSRRNEDMQRTIESRGREISYLNNKVEDILNIMEKIFPKNSVLFPPREHEDFGQPPPVIEREIEYEMDLIPWRQDRVLANACPQTVKTHCFYRVLCRIRKQRDRMGKALLCCHLAVGRSDVYYYYISEEAYNMMGIPKKRLSDMVARGLQEAMKEKRQERMGRKDV